MLPLTVSGQPLEISLERLGQPMSLYEPSSKGTPCVGNTQRVWIKRLMDRLVAAGWQDLRCVGRGAGHDQTADPGRPDSRSRRTRGVVVDCHHNTTMPVATLLPRYAAETPFPVVGLTTGCGARRGFPGGDGVVREPHGQTAPPAQRLVIFGLRGASEQKMQVGLEW